MPELLIRIKKKKDGDAALSCVRADGSVTWQRQEGNHGRFFPLHDLTHYAVETVLGHRRGFFGMLADGWDIGDFGAPWPKGPLPVDMDPTEAIVGLFDVERYQGLRLSVAELLDVSGGHVVREAVAGLTDEDLEAVRARRAELFALWEALPAGETLELPFDRAARP
ncbi:MAG: hypothetical protein AB7T31_15165 [Gemmatimonadales bacterium]